MVKVLVNTTVPHLGLFQRVLARCRTLPHLTSWQRNNLVIYLQIGPLLSAKVAATSTSVYGASTRYSLGSTTVQMQFVWLHSDSA